MYNKRLIYDSIDETKLPFFMKMFVVLLEIISTNPRQSCGLTTNTSDQSKIIAHNKKDFSFIFVFLRIL